MPCDLEAYNPQTKQWVPLQWSQRLGPVQSHFQVYFIWDKGVSILDQFCVLQGFANGRGVPGGPQSKKGKGCAY